MVQFNTLRKTSENLTKLTEKINKMKKPAGDFQNDKDDPTFWFPEVDKLGNGSATIRFCDASAVDGDDALPFVRMFHHGFKGPTGSWYIENSLTTLGQKDPMSEFNTTLWNTGLESDKDIAREQKRKTTYVSNIEVINDPKHPEKNGQFFKFKYGAQIFSKIEDAMHPGLDEEGNVIPGEEHLVPVNPFSFYDGAVFELKIRKVKGYPNYTKSYFVSTEEGQVISSAIRKDADGNPDEVTIKKIWESLHSLNDFISPSKFKTYAELKAKMTKVLGLDAEDTSSVKAQTKVLKEVVAKEDDDSPPFDTSDEGDDDVLSELNKLANA